MRSLVVYESMYGHTHAVAEAIGRGLRPAGEVRVIPTAEATPELEAWADLIVAGGPTHVHGMTHERTREMARAMAAKPESKETLDSAAAGPGIRDWLDALPATSGQPAAAFDTRAQGHALLTGRASAGIAKGLRRRGYRLAAEAESFFIDGEGKLLDGELDRAFAWGSDLIREPVLAG
jgi:hypothetical protein